MRIEAPDWILLEYPSREKLKEAVFSQDERVLFFPAIGKMEQGNLADVQVAVEGHNVLFPMKADVIDVRERPTGINRPRGVMLQVIEPDRERFDRMCEFLEESWQPVNRRSQPRYRTELPALYAYPEEYKHARVLDISAGGLFLRADGPLPSPGDTVQVRLITSRLKADLLLECEIRWIDKVEKRRGMGVLCAGDLKNLRRLQRLVNRIVKQAKIE